MKQLHSSDAEITSTGFISKDEIVKSLEGIFKKFRIKEQMIKEEVDSLSELLHKIKYTGTRGAGTGKKGFWTKGMINKLERIYREKFGKIIVTYHVLFCQAVNCE